MNNNSGSSLDNVVAVEVLGNRKSPLITLNFAANVKSGQCVVARRFSAGEIVSAKSMSWEERFWRVLELGLGYGNSDNRLRPLRGDFVLANSGADYAAPLKLCLSGSVQGRSLKSCLPKELQSYFIRPADVVMVVRDLSGVVTRAVDYHVRVDAEFGYSLSEKDAVFLIREIYSTLSGIDKQVIDDIFPDRYLDDVADRKIVRFKQIALDMLSIAEKGAGKAYYDAEAGKGVFGVKLAEVMVVITNLSRAVPVELFDLLRCESVIGHGKNYDKVAGRISDKKQTLNEMGKKELEHARGLLESALREKDGIVAHLGLIAEGYGSWGPITNIQHMMETLKSYGLLAAPVSATTI